MQSTKAYGRLFAVISAVLLMGIGISRGMGGEWGMAAPLIMGAIGFVILAWPRARRNRDEPAAQDEDAREP